MSNSFLSRCISSNNGLMAEGSETRFKVGLNELSLHSRWKLLSELVIVALLKKNKQDRQKVGCQKLHWLSYLPTVTEFLWASNSREISIYEQAIIISAAGRALLYPREDLRRVRREELSEGLVGRDPLRSFADLQCSTWGLQILSRTKKRSSRSAHNDGLLPRSKQFNTAAVHFLSCSVGNSNIALNRPFYSCILSCQAFDLEWGWRWPSYDRDQYLVSMVTK